MERRGRWYDYHSCFLLFSVHHLSWFKCAIKNKCSLARYNHASWILPFSSSVNQCLPLFHLRLRTTWLCVCVYVTLTAEVFDPISEVGVSADFLTLREKQRYLSNVQWLRRLLKKMHSDTLPFTIYQRFLDASATECLFVGFQFINLFV